MKQLGYALITSLFVSCAHFQETPKVVQFPFAPELLEKVQQESNNRMPASVVMSEEEAISPRRIYFSALYHQYLTIGQHLNKKSQVGSCPQFHHDKLQTDSSLIPKVSLYPATEVESEGKDFFPETTFNKNFSLKDYQANIKTELLTLCEYGVSDNFYKFDNLVTHYANKASFHQNTKAMVSVLKIPVFANFYLLKMIQTPGIHFPSQEEKRFIKITNTHWFESYVAQASRLRNNFIKNKMVSRSL